MKIRLLALLALAACGGVPGSGGDAGTGELGCLANIPIEDLESRLICTTHGRDGKYRQKDWSTCPDYLPSCEQSEYGTSCSCAGARYCEGDYSGGVLYGTPAAVIVEPKIEKPVDCASCEDICGSDEYVCGMKCLVLTSYGPACANEKWMQTRGVGACVRAR